MIELLKIWRALPRSEKTGGLAIVVFFPVVLIAVAAALPN